MSFRTTINGVQIFGNNETFTEWLDYLTTKGIEINEEGCYEGEINDFMEMLTVIENITMNMEKHRQEEITTLMEQEKKEPSEYLRNVLHNPMSKHYKRSIFDLREIYQDTKEEMDCHDELGVSLFDRLDQIVKNGYMFMPYAAFKACENDLEPTKNKIAGHFKCYRLKPGKTIKIKCS